MLEVDLSIFGDLELPESKEDEPDQETNELGFKPIVPNAIAKEIDASINSHSPLEYRLRKITIAKPDYSGVLSKQHMSMSRIQMDPRLRRYANTVKTAPKKEPSEPKEEPKENKEEQYGSPTSHPIIIQTIPSTGNKDKYLNNFLYSHILI